jgi:hypothetical protein
MTTGCESMQGDEMSLASAETVTMQSEYTRMRIPE